MKVIWWMLLLIIEIGLILVMAWRLDFEPTSSWDEYRKRNSGNFKNKQELVRRQIYPILITILVLKMIIATGIMLFLLQQIFEKWWQVIIIWLTVISLAFLISKNKLMRYQSQNLFAKIESKITPFLLKISWLKLNMFQQLSIKEPKLASRAELDYLLTHDQRIITESERQIVMSAHDFTEMVAEDLMVKISDLCQVKASDLLGPLAINELYETGEKLFVVYEKHKVLGLISLEDLVDLKSGKTFQAKELARQDYLEVQTNDKLNTVIHKMIEHQTMIALVVDKNSYLGIIELETILKQLKITNL
ncbi:MAG: CBS domain-containing protein [Candidatus Saccharibacteria bacterium]|nr:CBS domain-containing protein [Candidatus Saccharibacteria bacterium]